MQEERLQKFLSRAGVASRREAESMIAAGRVKVNGRTVKLGAKVDPDRDQVSVDGKKINAASELVYYAVHKPRGYVTSREAQFGRKSAYDLLPEKLRKKVWSVGRLDYNSEGLLIFTNDGELTQALTHPSFEHEKEYEVVLDKEFKESHKAKLEKGIDIGGYVTAPAKIKVLGEKELSIVISEGKYRQVRRMFDALGYTVRKLVRIREHKLKLKKLNLQVGNITEVDRDDIM